MGAVAALPSLATDITPTAWTLNGRGYNSAGNLAQPGITAENAYGWLNAVNDGWYATTGNSDMRWGYGTINADTHVVSLPNMSGTAGIAMAMKASVDLTDVNLTSLSFNFTMSETGNANQTYTLWYETTAGTAVQLAIVTDVAGTTQNTVLTAEQLAAVSIDGTGEFYAIFGYQGSGASAEISGISMTATTAIPEPATATLSLLALAGLAARRRRL